MASNRYQDDERQRQLEREAQSDAARSGAAMGSAQNMVLQTPIGGNMSRAQNAVLRTPTSGTGIAPAGLAGAKNVPGTGTGTVRTSLPLSQRPMIAQQGQSGNLVAGAYTPPAPAAQLGVNAQLAEDIASGKIAGNDAVNAYGKLAAGKMDELQSMGKFNYDFNKDPLFKILSQSYMQQAQQAANNASAMAAARSGGYGNSYGAAAASQQYNQALGNLYDQVPELQQAAYERYLNDRNDLYKQAGYYNDLGDTSWTRDYQQRQADRNQGNIDREFEAGEKQKEIDNTFRQTEADRNQGNIDREFEAGEKQKEIDNTYRQTEADRNQGNIDREFEAGREDTQWEHGQAEQKYKDSRADIEYDRGIEAYQIGKEAAQDLASLGYYDLLEQLYGIDLGNVRNDDALNRALSVIKTAGLTGQEALDILRQYVGVDFGNLIAGSSGSGGSSGGGGGSRRSSGGSYSGGTPTNTGTPTTTSTPVAETSLPGVYDVTEFWDRMNRNRRR